MATHKPDSLAPVEKEASLKPAIASKVDNDEPH
jgi:hypothetical protein